MKLVEVVVLMGAHCISPLQTTDAVTEAAKVQCAVVIEKDTTAGTIRIVPAGASTHPEVAAVIDRLDTTAPPDTTIQPASAPPAAPASARAPLASPAVPPAATAEVAAAEPQAAEAPAAVQTKTPDAEPPEVKKPKAKKEQAEVKPASQCLGTAKPKWYKTADGRRKYRCVKAG